MAWLHQAILPLQNRQLRKYRLNKQIARRMGVGSPTERYQDSHLGQQHVLDHPSDRLSSIPDYVPSRVVGLIILVMMLFRIAPVDVLTGTVLVRQRITCPPDAVMEAVIEDISRAIALETPFTRRFIAALRQPPIIFLIVSRPAAFDLRTIDALHATPRQEGQLFFTRDLMPRVFLAEGEKRVDVHMETVQGCKSDISGPAIGAHSLRLPATFLERLAYLDCVGMRYYPDLWLYQCYEIGRTWRACYRSLRWSTGGKTFLPEFA